MQISGRPIKEAPNGWNKMSRWNAALTHPTFDDCRPTRWWFFFFKPSVPCAFSKLVSETFASFVMCACKSNGFFFWLQNKSGGPSGSPLSLKHFAAARLLKLGACAGPTWKCPLITLHEWGKKRGGCSLLLLMSRLLLGCAQGRRGEKLLLRGKRKKKEEGDRICGELDPSTSQIGTGNLTFFFPINGFSVLVFPINGFSVLEYLNKTIKQTV